MRPVTFEQACYEPERCQLEVDEGRRRGWDIEMMMNDTACKVRAVRQLYLEQIDLGPYRKYVDGIRYDDQHPEAPTMFAGVDFHPETLQGKPGKRSNIIATSLLFNPLAQPQLTHDDVVSIVRYHEGRHALQGYHYPKLFEKTGWWQWIFQCAEGLQLARDRSWYITELDACRTEAQAHRRGEVCLSPGYAEVLENDISSYKTILRQLRAQHRAYIKRTIPTALFPWVMA
jgi:hypothetical protein